MLILNGHQGPVYALAFSPDGQYLASAGGTGREVWLWDLSTGKVAHRWEHEYKVVCLSFSPDSSMLATADTKKRAHLCRFGGVSGQQRPCWQQPLGEFGTTPSRHLQAVFNPTGTTLAISAPLLGGRDSAPYRAWEWRAVSLWKVTGSACGQERLLDPGARPSCLAWSPDGARLAVGSFKGSVRLIGVRENKVEHTFYHHAKVHFLAYSSDGRFVVAGTPGGLIRVWETATGHLRTNLRGQGCQLHALTFSPDGHTLASAGQDGRVRMWDVESGRARDGFDWGVGEVHSVAFAPDGMKAAAGGQGAIVLWDIDSWA